MVWEEKGTYCWFTYWHWQAEPLTAGPAAGFFSFWWVSGGGLQVQSGGVPSHLSGRQTLREEVKIKEFQSPNILTTQSVPASNGSNQPSWRAGPSRLISQGAEGNFILTGLEKVFHRIKFEFNLFQSTCTDFTFREPKTSFLVGIYKISN